MSENNTLKDAISAMEELRDDLLERANVGSDGTRVVNVSNGRWIKFKESIQALKSLEAEAVGKVAHAYDNKGRDDFIGIIEDCRNLKVGDKLYSTPQPPAVPDGYCLAPKEPNANMKCAASQLFARNPKANPVDYYKAMIARVTQGGE